MSLNNLPMLDAANPYTDGLPPGNYDGPIIVVEQQLDAGMWSFKGVPHYIEKALKIPYTYRDANNVVIRDYLLIGFAGGGAY
jgi:hypothetical protein